jgi:hypothetical protein
MAWFINELSFTGQFDNQDSFLYHLKGLLKLRSQNAAVKDKLYCSRLLPSLKVVDDLTVRDVVNAQRDPVLKKLVLEWIDKKGPFLDDIRQNIENDDFELFDKVVTNLGAGEAVRQKILGNYSALYSLETPDWPCNTTRLIVNQITNELEVIAYQIDNFWDVDNLVLDIESKRGMPKSWQCMIDTINEIYPSLSISDDIINFLSPHPFSLVICSQVINIMKILNDLVDSRNDNGEYTKEGHDILKEYFLGDGAKITDESKTNKGKFKDEMTFKDPRNKKNKIFCPWHAKISSRYYRIHFEFPISADSKTMAICYIGPKITIK